MLSQTQLWWTIRAQYIIDMYEKNYKYVQKVTIHNEVSATELMECEHHGIQIW